MLGLYTLAGLPWDHLSCEVYVYQSPKERLYDGHISVRCLIIRLSLKRS